MGVVIPIPEEPPSVQFCSVALSCPTLRPHGLQHARPPCPSPTPGVYSNSCPLSRWCHPTISSSVILFSSFPQSFPASGSFPMSWPFASGGQGIGASTIASVLPVSIQGWFPFGLTALISLWSKGLSRISSSTTVLKASTLRWSSFFMVQLSHLNMTVNPGPGSHRGWWKMWVVPLQSKRLSM